MFDGIYTGTETRDPVITDQHLQQYESYMIVRYFDNIAADSKNGRNGGGWVDIYANRYLDRYAEQLWDTMLAKTPQIMLFQYSDLLRPAEWGDRGAWSGDGNFVHFGRVGQVARRFRLEARRRKLRQRAGYALNTVNAVLGKLGKPVGIASYKPYQSTGEDFLHNYLGMIGIPIELYPQFPADAKTVLLTEQARFDPDLVDKIRTHLENGGNVVITSGLLKTVAGQGHRADRRNPHHRQHAARQRVLGGAGRRSGRRSGQDQHVLVPEISFLTNDAWPVVRGTANGRGAPLLLMDRYSKGILYRPHDSRKHQRSVRPSAAGAHGHQAVHHGRIPGMDGCARQGEPVRVRQQELRRGVVSGSAPATVDAGDTAGAGAAFTESRHRRRDDGKPAESHGRHRAHAPQRWSSRSRCRRTALWH